MMGDPSGWGGGWRAVVDTSARLIDAALARGEMPETIANGHVETTLCRGARAGVTTKLHLDLFVTVVPSAEASRQHLDGLLSAALTYSANTKVGQPLGLQTGVAALTVVVTDLVDPTMVAWTNRRTNRFAALGVPILVDAPNRAVHAPKGSYWGWAYNRPLRRAVDTMVREVIAGPHR